MSSTLRLNHFVCELTVLIQVPSSPKHVTSLCSTFTAKFSSFISVIRSDNLHTVSLKFILLPRSSITISQLSDVLGEEHDSLNVFSTEEDSTQQIEKIVFLDPSFLAYEMINVQIRRQVNRALCYSRHFNKSQCKFTLTRHLYSILILGDAKYFMHCAFHNLTNFSISPAVNYRI